MITVWDFNVAPRMSVFTAQIDYEAKKVYVLEEVLGRPEDKENNTPALARNLRAKLYRDKHVGGVDVTGDPAGLQRSTTSEDGVNNFTVIVDTFGGGVLRPHVKLLKKQPPQVTRCEFVNEVFDGYNGWEIAIDIKCRKLTEDCYVHAFYVGKNQWMEEGIYVYLFSETISFPKLLSNLNLFRETIVLDMLKRGIQCTFPYKTLFHEGILFGGKFILKKLAPHFHFIWNAYCKLVTRHPRSIEKVPKILATLLLIELRPRLADLQSSSHPFFHEFCDSLVLEAVDPNGLYNIFQMKAARIATLKWYAETYDNNASNYQNLILAITQNSTVGICQLRECINQLFKEIQLINDDEIFLPDIYNNKRDVFLMNICNHVMSIFQLTPTEKFGVVYNYSRYIQAYAI